MDVLGAETRREPCMHVPKVAWQRPVGGNAAQSRLPGVEMCVDEARDNDPVAPVHHHGARCLDRRRDPSDAAVLHEEVALGEVADAIVHGDDARALNEDGAHGGASGSEDRGLGLGRSPGPGTGQEVADGIALDWSGVPVGVLHSEIGRALDPLLRHAEFTERTR
jgi:hypothetical protein